MGERHPYRCPACGYLALVSGGDDCGFFVATRTVVCDRCAKILDVVASADTLSRPGDAPSPRQTPTGERR